VDYLDKEVIPDFLGGECVVSVRLQGLGCGRGRSQRLLGRGCRGPRRLEWGPLLCVWVLVPGEVMLSLFGGAGLVFEAAPKRGEFSPKEGPYLVSFKHSDPDGSFQKPRDQASQRFTLVFPTQYVARQQSEFTC